MEWSGVEEREGGFTCRGQRARDAIPFQQREEFSFCLFV